MIDDAFPWREQLLRSAGILERRKSQRRWTERTTFLIERDIMMGCYGIRKLTDAFKVSDEVASRTWAVTIHPLLRPRPPDIMSRDKLWDYYNLAAGDAVHLGIKPLCNQVIHSWVWTVSVSEDLAFDGIYVASDTQRFRGLYFVQVDCLIALFRAVGEDDIVSAIMNRDEHGDAQWVRRSSRHLDSPRDT